MNPEDNKTLSNPFSTSDSDLGMGGTPMPDNLASAQDSLTAAGMAASQSANSNAAVPLDSASMDGSDVPTLPQIEEPLVPADPVPGSIGSAISMPPADPISAPAFSNPNDLPQANPMQPSGPMPAPDVAPSPAPFNPFASQTPSAQPGPSAASSLSQQPAPSSPDLTPSSAPQPAPAPAPMDSIKPKAKASFSPMVIILAIISLLLLISTVTFFLLWNQEKGNVKPVYYPQVSDDTNSTLTVLSCSRSESRDMPIAAGTSTVTIGYAGDKISAFDSKLSLNYTNETDASAARDENVVTVETMAGLVGGSLSVSGNADGANYTYSISSQDGIDVAESDAMNAIYGADGGSLALDDVRAKYEAEGYICAEE